MIYVIYYPDSTSHAALLLSGLEERNFYISYFPPKSFRDPGFRLHQFNWDYPRHHPATVVAIPSIESEGFGLSEQAIYDWWDKSTLEPFGWLKSNCSSRVIEALKVGQKGSEYCGKQIIIKRTYFPDTPTKAIDYAQALSNRLSSHLFSSLSATEQALTLHQQGRFSGLDLVLLLMSKYDFLIQQKITSPDRFLGKKFLVLFAEIHEAIFPKTMSPQDTSGSLKEALKTLYLAPQDDESTRSSLARLDKVLGSETMTEFQQSLKSMIRRVKKWTHLQGRAEIKVVLDEVNLDPQANPKRYAFNKGDEIRPSERAAMGMHGRVF